MPKWGRLLLRCGAAAAALLLAMWAAPRFGVVYVGGWSMRPSYCAGDLAVYRRGSAGVRERDVVLFVRRDGARLLHRVTGIMLDGTLRTRGDANLTPDAERARSSDVEGVVVGVVPCGRVVHAVVSAVRWCYNHVPIANMRR